MSASASTKEATAAMKSTNWRKPSKPSYDEAEGLTVKKKRSSQGASSDFDINDPATHGPRVPVAGASPLRSASSIGFTSDSFFDISDETDNSDLSDGLLFRSKVGILNSFAISAVNTITTPAKRAASAVMGYARSRRRSPKTHAVDIVMVDDLCEQTACRAHNGEFPIAEIECIKNSKRFKSPKMALKMYEQEEQECGEEGELQYDEQIEETEITPRKDSLPIQDGQAQDALGGSAEHQANNAIVEAPAAASNQGKGEGEGEGEKTLKRKTTPTLDAATLAILSDVAVVSVAGIKGRHEPRAPVDVATSEQGYINLIGKLKNATKEKKILDLLNIGATVSISKSSSDERMAVRTGSRRNEERSDDSGIAMQRTHTRQQSSASLNPTAREFVAQQRTPAIEGPATIEDPAIIALGKPVKVKGSHAAEVSKGHGVANNLRAMADTIDRNDGVMDDIAAQTLVRYGISSSASQDLATVSPPQMGIGPIHPMANIHMGGHPMAGHHVQGYPTPPFSPPCGLNGAPHFMGPHPPPPPGFPPGFHGHALHPLMGPPGPVPPVPSPFPGFAGGPPLPHQHPSMTGPHGPPHGPLGPMPLMQPVNPGPMFPHGPMGAMMTPFPPPPAAGPLPHPPPGYGPGAGFASGPFGPRFNFNTCLQAQPQHPMMQPAPQPPIVHQQPPMMQMPCANSAMTAGMSPHKPIRKPRIPDATRQQEYEAHIEWRKANEPGYAQMCKERQQRRAQRSTGQSSNNDQASMRSS